MIGSSGNAQNDTNSGIIQPCRSKTLSFNPEALWGSGVGCYNGDKWSHGLTYFSFWEGLLWPASALNCALDPESKGKPKMEKKKWERQQKGWGQEETDKQPNQRVLGLKLTSVKGMKDWTIQEYLGLMVLQLYHNANSSSKNNLKNWCKSMKMKQYTHVLTFFLIPCMVFLTI